MDSNSSLVSMNCNFVLVGCMVVGNDEGVHIMLGPDGRETGEAFVELMSSEDVKQALAKNKCHIGRRYIDGNTVIPSTRLLRLSNTNNLLSMPFVHTSFGAHSCSIAAP